MKRIMMLCAIMCAVAIVMGCTDRVPPGHVGMVMTPDGLTGVLLQPGNHTCYFRDKLYLIETKEEDIKEPMNILCKDDLNFSFHLHVMSRPRKTDAKAMLELLNRKGADVKKVSDDVFVLKFETMYRTYVNPVARNLARGEVSKYETTQVREHREDIQKIVLSKLIKAAEGTPMEIIRVTTSNFDYPEVITKAVEKKRQREIELQEEKAKQAMALLRTDNRLKIAEKMKVVRAAEAESDAVYVRIMGKSFTAKYLEWKRIMRDITLYERVGPGDKVIVSGAVLPIVNTVSRPKPVAASK